MEAKPQSSVSPYRMRAEILQARINELAQDSCNIRWSHHARQRMETRGITIRVALTVLQVGVIVGPIEPGENPGEWKAKVVRHRKGQRDVGVIVVVIRDSSILVKTVEWEDQP